AAGGSVSATWSGIAAPTPTDWIGLYASGAGDGAFLAWLYVSCSQTPGAARASGSCTLQVPGGVAPGVYQLRLFAANGVTRLATSSVFNVTPGGLSFHREGGLAPPTGRMPRLSSGAGARRRVFHPGRVERRPPATLVVAPPKRPKARRSRAPR